jgi:hypothetical protein
MRLNRIGGSSLVKSKRKLDAALAAIQMNSWKRFIAVAALSTNDEYILAKIMLAKPPNDY